MHDCQATRARLIDLICGEADDAERLSAEVRSCAACAQEHRALSEVFRSFDRAADEVRPAEEFWPRYRARLARRIHAAESEAALAPVGAARVTRARARTPPAAWLRRALAAQWRVPAPVAVAALTLIACLAPLALRRPSVAVAPVRQVNECAPLANQSASTASEPAVRTIEIPVVYEKIVTRTVYVARPARKAARSARTEDARLAANSPSVRNEAAPRRDTLTGFRPAGDVRLRVIKGSFENER